MTAPAIRAIETRLITVPLARPWGPGVTVNHVVRVRVEDDDGRIGDGFSWTPTIGATAVQALLDHDIRSWALGRPAEPLAIWDPLWAHLHEAGGGGITTIAMAGLDLALWDLAAMREGRSVPQRIGIRRRRLEVYGSGVNRHLDRAELLAQAARWCARGYRAVKIKVGGRPLAEDLDRVAAVRDLIGARGLMVDANQLWTLEEAQEAATALARFDVRWLEEPLRADDLLDYRRLAAASPIPLAAGENLHTRSRFREFLDAGAIAIVQPNVVRVGGITPFLRIAVDAAERGIPVYPHLLPELSGLVAACLVEEAPVEDVEDSSLEALGLIARSPIAIDGPRAELVDLPGLGLEIRTEDAS